MPSAVPANSRRAFRPPCVYHTQHICESARGVAPTPTYARLRKCPHTRTRRHADTQTHTDTRARKRTHERVIEHAHALHPDTCTCTLKQMHTHNLVTVKILGFNVGTIGHQCLTCAHLPHHSRHCLVRAWVHEKPRRIARPRKGNFAIKNHSMTSSCRNWQENQRVWHGWQFMLTIDLAILDSLHQRSMSFAIGSFDLRTRPEQKHDDTRVASVIRSRTAMKERSALSLEVACVLLQEQRKGWPHSSS